MFLMSNLNGKRGKCDDCDRDDLVVEFSDTTSLVCTKRNKNTIHFGGVTQHVLCKKCFLKDLSKCLEEQFESAVESLSDIPF